MPCRHPNHRRRHHPTEGASCGSLLRPTATNLANHHQAKRALLIEGRFMPSAMDHGRTGLAVVLGTAFTWIGVQHFVDVDWFVPIVPAILGWPEFWVYVSGAAEILLGLGLIIPSTRARAGRWTAGFLLLVYWANLNMWVNDIAIGGQTFSTPAHIARALAQIGMIAVALFIAQSEPIGTGIEEES